jgi:MFS family permease
MRTTPQPAILATLSLSTLLSSLGTSIANVALPALSRAFHAPPARVQWVVLAYLLGVSALVVAAGRLGDLIGRKRLLAAGILGFSLAAALCAAAPALPVLIAARALQGAGAAAMMALTMAAVRDALPADATARAMGLLGTVSAAGTALGPSLGGALVGGFGWRVVFVVQAVLGGLALLCVGRFLPADTGLRSRPRFDHRGTLLLALTLTAYALALTPGAVPRLLTLPLAVGGAVLFVVTERRSAAPLVDLTLFRDPVLATGFATSLLATAVVMASLVVGPYYLSGVLGLSNGRMGLAMAAGPIVAALAGVPAGRVVDGIGAPRATLAGLAAMAAGACLLWAVPPAGVGAYVAPLAVITAGYALFQAANNTAVMSTPAAERRGLVSGLLGLSRNLGLVSGAAFMGAVFMQGAGESALQSPAALVSGFRACFGLAALLLGLAILAAARGLRVAAPAADTFPR